MASPILDHDLCLLQCVEGSTVEQFIAQLAVETLAVTILPWTARLDVSGPGSDGGDPVLERLDDEFRASPERMYAGISRETNSSQSASMTSVALSFRAIRMARLLRLNSSMMHNIRNALPLWCGQRRSHRTRHGWAAPAADGWLQHAFSNPGSIEGSPEIGFVARQQIGQTLTKTDACLHQRRFNRRHMETGVRRS